MIPVGIEHVRYVLHDATDSDDVEVTELGVFSHPEILVGDIAPADNRYLVIDSERLVVHAAVNAPEPGQGALGPPGRTAVERIEYTDLEVRMRVQRGHANVVARCEHVVEQESDTYAAVGRLEQIIDEHAADEVAFDEVVLH